MVVRLRNFLYLDGRLVQSHLEQLEGGNYDEERQKSARTKAGEVGGELGITGAKAGGKRGGSDSSESERVLVQTASSRFVRLYDKLDEAGAIQTLEACDDGIWDQLHRQEVLEIEADIELPAMAKILDTTARMEPLAQMMEAFGQDVLDDKAKEAIAGFNALGRIGDDQRLSIVASLAGSRKYKFVCHLDREFLLTSDPTDLEAELTVFGVLTRKTRRGETIAVGGPLTDMLKALPRSKRREAERDMKKVLTKDGGLGVTTVPYPSAIVSPIAIYS